MWRQLPAQVRLCGQNAKTTMLYNAKQNLLQNQLKSWMLDGTYVVPAIFVLMWVISSGNSLAKPKSPIFGLKSLSRSILLALMSLCTIRGTSSSWRYARPLAIPMQISDRLLHWRLIVLLLPVQTKEEREKITSSTSLCSIVRWFISSSLEIFRLYQVMHDQGYYFLGIHRPTSD